MFDSLLEEVTNRDRQFTVYQGDDETDIAAQFESHAVTVTEEPLPPGGPDPFVVIEDNDEFAGALPVEELENLLEPPIVRPGQRDDVSDGFGVLFDLLDETVFVSIDRRQLLAVSREIEDRVARVGSGTLRVSFQKRSRFEPQLDIYRYLAGMPDLDIHIYGLDPETAPEIPDVTYHRGAELDRYWTLAFDGGTDARQVCALIARERNEHYDGFWTYDQELVTDILSSYPE